VFRSHRTGQVSGVTQLETDNEVIGLSFESFGWDTLTAFPVTQVVIPGESRAVEVANLGLLGKMTGIAAVLGSSINVAYPERIRSTLRLKALGKLGLWIFLVVESGRNREESKDDLMV